MLSQLSPLDIIFFSLVFTFVIINEVNLVVRKIILRWIYYLDWRKREFDRYNRLRPIIVKSRKPWDCWKCMTGWCALALALLNGYGWESLLWCAVGMFAGALFEAIKNRYL